ncbi:expressed unknown protein [Seminavis robusta]|uniref:Uncharacterized protein n=1 Tax=Seminavis robusta TaxID=568900 RepID=A0A9N8DIF4_9STRA|nr:expressed unknown protein [Seminavis robusta]|eukprot:Sro169_g075120.1 n/a (204) ;mRNA; r:50505-51626
MRFSAIFIASLVPATAFQPFPMIPTTTYVTPTTLFANSENIRAAMDASERYGPTSPEARLAWETVEEFDANANAANAYSGNEEYRLTEEQLANAYQEVQQTMEMLLRRTQHWNRQYNEYFMKDVIAELQAIKLAPPEKKPAPQIPGLWDSKLKARAITQQYGTQSKEAQLAWEEVEEIAATGLQNAMGDANSTLRLKLDLNQF